MQIALTIGTLLHRYKIFLIKLQNLIKLNCLTMLVDKPQKYCFAGLNAKFGKYKWDINREMRGVSYITSKFK